MKVLSNRGLLTLILKFLYTKVQEENVKFLSFAELDSLRPEELSS